MIIAPDSFEYVLDFLKGVSKVVNFLLFELFMLILLVIGAVAVIRNHLKK